MSADDISNDAQEAADRTHAQIGLRSRFAATVEDYDSESESDGSDDEALEEEEELDDEGLSFWDTLNEDFEREIAEFGMLALNCYIQITFNLYFIQLKSSRTMTLLSSVILR